ncbi:MAG: type II secretion system protein N [Sulfuriflexus sp.]|nr:type II secretion system protein N [Pseudomonadota bacterium]MCK4744292.1 type II secretion system protein N [Sulfuriflexus sp.]
MRPLLSTAIFVVVILVVTFIYKLPANFIYKKFSNVSPVELIGISGSIWSGHIDSINTPQLTVGQLSWQLSAWPLLVGDVDVQWKLEDPALQLQGEMSLSGEELSLINITGHIDLVELGERLPEQVILLAGIINLDIPRAKLKQSELIDISGKITWQSAKLLSPANIEFGDFKAALSNNSGKLLADLSDTGGAVSLAGVFNLSPQGLYDYSVEIGVRDTSVPGLLEGFNQLGRHDKNGLAKLRGKGFLF